MFYVLHGTTTDYRERGAIVTQIPTFFLHSSVQGIVSEEHALEIGKEVVNPTRDERIVVSLYASRVQELCPPDVK